MTIKTRKPFLVEWAQEDDSYLVKGMELLEKSKDLARELGVPTHYFDMALTEAEKKLQYIRHGARLCSTRGCTQPVTEKGKCRFYCESCSEQNNS
jgi:hypothetical protein